MQRRIGRGVSVSNGSSMGLAVWDQGGEDRQVQGTGLEGLMGRTTIFSSLEEVRKLSVVCCEKS
jgi:hypothetical protein